MYLFLNFSSFEIFCDILKGIFIFNMVFWVVFVIFCFNVLNLVIFFVLGFWIIWVVFNNLLGVVLSGLFKVGVVKLDLF